jgi:selenide,water dikinase
VEAPIEIHRELVLVGGGHAHALALRMLAMRPIQGLRITLISPVSHTPYSGMLPGLVAGHYRFEETHIDLSRLCQWAGVRFIAAEVTGLDPTRRSLTLAGRPAIEYDLLSLDIGSQPELDSVPGAREHAVPVKPVAGLWRRWQDLEARLDAGGDVNPRIAVVGGGAGGVELALAMAQRLQRRPVAIGLWCAAPEILQYYNRRARAAVMDALAGQGVSVHLNARVASVQPGCLSLEGGRDAPFDELFWCTGAAAAPWVAASGLSTDRGGFLQVRDTLQALDDDRIFAAGDIATQVNHPRPKAGVFAVRQGPVLAHNLRALLLGRPLRAHRPQRRFLSLVSLGARRATADKGPFSATGAWVWRWKDRIDRKFMDRFTDLPTSMPIRHWGRLPEADVASQLPCGGCGAKVGAPVLAEVLAELAAEHPGQCTGGEGAEDVALIPASGRVVQSIDLLREMVGDPYVMGRIAANHALSDLYASGARPVSALAAVILPFGGAAIQRRDLRQLLAGALAEFIAAGCSLAGGHSMQGRELSLGFAVNGVSLAADGRLLGKRGLRPGDRLVLTKPLGTGALFAAAMQLAADGRHIAAATENMLVSNGPAAELALANKASACTDITGFGLLGHLLEMLTEDLGASLRLDALPALDGALAAMEAGIFSTAHPANAAAGCAVELRRGVDDVLPELLYDPQTSGGLLIGVEAGHAEQLCGQLRQAGYTAVRVIGEVTRPGSGPRVLVA